MGRHGHEASKVDLPQPRKCILFGLVDWKFRSVQRVWGLGFGGLGCGVSNLGLKGISVSVITEPHRPLRVPLFRVWGLWFIASGFRIHDLGSRIWGLGFGVWVSESRVWGLGCSGLGLGV